MGYIRAIVAFTLGVAMLFAGDAAMVLSVRLLGALIMVSGIFSLVLAIRKSNSNEKSLSIASSAVSILTAVLMFVFAGKLVTLVGYMFGVAMVAAGLLQLVVMFGANRVFPVGYMSFVLPSLVLVAGALIIAAPFLFADLIGVLTAVTLIIYAVSEFLSSWKMNTAKAESSVRQSTKQETSGKGMHTGPVKDVDYEKVDEQ